MLPVFGHGYYSKGKPHPTPLPKHTNIWNLTLKPTINNQGKKQKNYP